MKALLVLKNTRIGWMQDRNKYVALCVRSGQCVGHPGSGCF